MCIRDRATHYEEGIWDTPEAKTCFDIVAKLASYTNPITPAPVSYTHLLGVYRAGRCQHGVFVQQGGYELRHPLPVLPAIEDGVVRIRLAEQKLHAGNAQHDICLLYTS